MNTECEIKVQFPDRLACKAIAGEGTGGKFASVVLVVPTIVAKGEKFTAKIAIVDKYGLAASKYPEELNLNLPEMEFTQRLTFPASKPPLAEISGLCLNKEGIVRFRAEFGNGQYFDSNPCVVKENPDYNICWGDPHVHTALSNCMIRYGRSLAFSFHAARHLSCLDWVSAADHVSNGRCELARWKEEVAGANMHDDPSEFVTLPAYEASLQGGCGGDNNVYMNKFPSLFIDEYEGGDTVTLSEKLAEKSAEEGFDFIVVPHHTSRTGKHGEINDDIYPGEDRMPVVEIHSKWGTSEYRGNPNPLKEVHPGPSYVVDLLNRGLMMGFVGGTDTHTSMTFADRALEAGNIQSMPGITAVRTKKLNRDGIFSAIRNRNCYAAAGERIYLEFSANDVGMGNSFKADGAGSIVLQSTVAAPGNIKTVEFVRDGQTIKTFTPGSWHGGFEFEDSEVQNDWLHSSRIGNFHYYYVRITCLSGALAWSSPVWCIQ